MEYLMKWFTIDELCESSTARRLHIDNRPSVSVKAALRALVEHLLDPLREAWGHPLRVNSGYRCEALNRAVGGVSNSQHLLGEAADITAGSRDANRRLLAMINKLGLPYDQLIDECNGRWLHVSYRAGHNRHRELRL